MQHEFTGLWRQKLSKKDQQPKINGLSFMDFIDLLDYHGYSNIHSLTTMEVNPLKWPRKQWRFAVDLISRACNISEDETRKIFDTPTSILKAFCESMRKTGLVIQLQQIQMRPVTPEEITTSEKTVWKQK